jgi:hypothetical protein
MSRSFSVIALGAVLWFLAASTVLAEDNLPAKESHLPAVKQPPLRTGEAAIKEALAQPTEMDFVNSPLSDVADYFKDYHGVTIQIDQKSLREANVDSATLVTMKLKGVTLRSALNLILKEIGLTWTIRDEVLLITTPEAADEQLTTKVLDVSDLVVYRDKDDKLWDDYDSLIEAITTIVKPTSWDATGGPGTIAGASLGTAKVLVVSQAWDVHEEVAQLLADIREVAKKHADEKAPQRDKPQAGSARIHPGSYQKILKLLDRIHAIAKEFPEKEQSPASEPPKEQGGKGGGGMF